MRAWKRQNPSSDNLGFTLIEIMLVIAVAGILAVVTLPKYNGVTNRYHLESSAQQIAGSLKYAKQLAMDQRKYIAIVLKTNSVQNYEIRVDGSGNLLEAVPYGDALVFDRGVTLTGERGLIHPAPGDLLSDPYVYYSNKGFLAAIPGSDPAEPVTMTLSKAGQTMTIEIIPQTGYVSVY